MHEIPEKSVSFPKIINHHQNHSNSQKKIFEIYKRNFENFDFFNSKRLEESYIKLKIQCGIKKTIKNLCIVNFPMI